MSSRSGAPPRASSPRAQRTRRRIVRAAGACFAESGFARTTVEEIARRAQVSKASIYVHFAGKEELLQVVLEQTLSEWRSATWEQVARRGGGALDAIRTMHEASIAYAREHPVLRTILVRDERLLLAGDDGVARRSMEVWRERVLAVVRRGVESGEIRSDIDAERLADVIRLWHLAFLDRLYAESLIDVRDPELVAASAAVLTAGLAAARE